MNRTLCGKEVVLDSGMDVGVIAMNPQTWAAIEAEVIFKKSPEFMNIPRVPYGSPAAQHYSIPFEQESDAK